MTTRDPLKTPDMLPDKVVQPISGEEGIPGEEALHAQPSPTPFSLQKGQTSSSQTQEKISPLNLPSEATSAQVLSQPADLATQATSLTQQINALKAQLQTPNLQFKPSTEALLYQHLQSVKDNLSAISSRLQLPVPTPSSQPPIGGAIGRFVDYLTVSQQQLTSISDSLSQPEKIINPGDLLRIQVKMSTVQQQVQFFSVLFNKSLDNIKTIMNIQS